ncbi:RNA degradosome polyphosphate kinase [Sulfurospirillum diekertiae]|uniref:Polyphosphate kinase n=1 Tax=Sulfurospirillum diekertiae TaxID=1854492 RepID=A0A1Y0HM81_9BACT|nr:RNA degradosome polyphosphate kinase [Sulfurospirillum diekertiae]ARU49227.1 Polyphosphate kinase [Sulfurospirillum diekertiae]ASC94037.1 Polyphosphate kinase [Sulfurospirillum diekertiae]
MLDLNDSSLYLNRELSWLKFNTRVLTQSLKKELPLFERLKFLAIYATNLDEFYMIRVAGLKQLFSAGVIETGADQKTPLDQLREIRTYLSSEKEIIQSSYEEIVKDLEKENLFITDYDNLTPSLAKLSDDYFFSNVLPVIVPIAVNATHPFPHLNNLSFSLAVKLQDSEIEEEGNYKYGMIRIPRVLPRFFQAGDNTYVPIETIVKKHAEEIFPGYKLVASAAFRVTRNADMVIEEEEADDFMMIMEQGLKLRRKGAFVRLNIQDGTDPDLLNFLNSHMQIFFKDIYAYKIPLNLGALWQIVGNKDFSHLALPPYNPKTLPPFDSNESVFKVIDKGDVLLFHPYESFDPVLRLIREASKDPKVVSIRMTLYRVEKNSQIVQALIDAANEGKQVTAVVELKARFDEENNLHWAKALEQAGAHVVYGITGFKVHAKIAQVIRQEEDGKLKFYMHFSTGNYNGATAKVYTDTSFFTCKEDFAKDGTMFFHILSGFSKHKKLDTLSMSPTQIKPKIISLIHNEAKYGAEGRIIAKMNSLVDSDVIQALYYASMQGVQIDIIARGICCLRPNVQGISENIRVKSIIGKYLEHARIFYFKHGDPTTTFISSADWMPRNLERRLELMTPIFDKTLQQKLFEILQLQLNDNVLSWNLENNGDYTEVEPTEERAINNHTVLEDYMNKIYKAQKKDTSSHKAEKLARRLFKES